MTELFASGRIVDLILLILGGEVALLALWRRRHQQEIRAAKLMLAALPGVFLLLALRASLTAAPWWEVAIWLVASFPAQLCDWFFRRP